MIDLMTFYTQTNSMNVVPGPPLMVCRNFEQVLLPGLIALAPGTMTTARAASCAFFTRASTAFSSPSTSFALEALLMAVAAWARAASSAGSLACTLGSFLSSCGTGLERTCLTDNSSKKKNGKSHTLVVGVYLCKFVCELVEKRLRLWCFIGHQMKKTRGVLEAGLECFGFTQSIIHGPRHGTLC